MEKIGPDRTPSFPNQDAASKADGIECNPTQVLQEQALPHFATYLTDEELEQDMQKLLCRDQHVDKSLTFSDSTFDAVANLLRQADRDESSLRPRTFTVLWIIKAPDLLEDFIKAEAWDIALPYAYNSLPKTLSPSQRHQFLDKQDAVMTKAAKIEEGSESAHANFGRDAGNHLESLELIGRGGFGSVDRVRSKLSRKIYARKTMKRSTLFEQDQKAVNLFRKEIGAMRKLNHRHLVRYVGSYTDPVHVGILMEPVAECDLRTFLSRTAPTAADVNCIRQSFGCLCAAIMYLQEKKIRHKDIKPENILIDKSQVYITDFGLARDWTGKGRSTTTGVVKAHTHAYAAPEVLEQQPRNTSSDVWSLGCVFLDMVTVLKGKTLIEKKRHFESNGSLDNCISTNQEAYKGWMKEIQSDYDNYPLEWVTNMIREKPKARLTPQLLMAQISDCDDDKRYCGLCCDGQDDDPLLTKSEDEDDPSSAVDSDAEEDIGKKTLNPVTIEKRLCNAAKTGDILSAKRWLRKASKMLSREGKSRSSFQTKALHEAARTGNEEVAELLIKFSCNLELRFDGKTPLLTAAANSHEGMIDLLVKNKAKLDAQDSREWDTALHIVADRSLSDAMQSLLRNRANPNIRNRQTMTPLMIAVSKHNAYITKGLLNYKANAWLKDGSGATATNLAVRWGCAIKYVEQLLDHQIDIDEQSAPLYHTALHTAAHFGQVAMAKFLLGRGANLNMQQKGAHHATALHLAVLKRHYKVTELLLEWNADLEIRTLRDDTPLLLATQTRQKNILELLLKSGADPNARSKKWVTPLSISLFESADLDIAQRLIDHGADIEARGARGETYLHHTAGRNDEKTMQFMLDNNANIDAEDLNGVTPLITAARGERLVSLGMLLEHGAKTEPEAKYRGGSALHAAAYTGLVESVSLLLAFGADPSAGLGGDGLIPGIIAQNNKHSEAAKLLWEAAAQRDERYGPSVKVPGFDPQHDGLKRGGLVRIEKSSSPMRNSSASATGHGVSRRTESIPH